MTCLGGLCELLLLYLGNGIITSSGFVNQTILWLSVSRVYITWFFLVTQIMHDELQHNNGFLMLII